MREELSSAFPDVMGGQVPGERGAFEVIVDDVLVFSKLELDRFPNPGEIVQSIEDL